MNDPTQRPSSRIRERKDRIRRAWRQTSLPNKLLVGIQAVTLLVLVAYTAETYLLWRESVRSYSAAKASADATRESVSESKRQFDLLQEAAARQAAAEADRFERAMRGAEERARKDQELTRESIAVAREAIATANRAELSVANRGDLLLQAGTPQSLWAEIKNTGRAMARLRSVSMYAGVFPTTSLPEDAADNLPDVPPFLRTSVPPGDSTTLNMNLNPLSQDAIDAVMLRGSLFYFFGHVDYFDGFANRRLRFCFYGDKQGGKWHSCKNNNWSS